MNSDENFHLSEMLNICYVIFGFKEDFVQYFETDRLN